MKKQNTKKVKKKNNEEKKVIQRKNNLNKRNIGKNELIKDFAISMSFSILIEIFKYVL